MLVLRRYVSDVKVASLTSLLELDDLFLESNCSLLFSKSLLDIKCVFTKLCLMELVDCLDGLLG